MPPFVADLAKHLKCLFVQGQRCGRIALQPAHNGHAAQGVGDAGAIARRGVDLPCLLEGRHALVQLAKTAKRVLLRDARLRQQHRRAARECFLRRPIGGGELSIGIRERTGRSCFGQFDSGIVLQHGRQLAERFKRGQCVFRAAGRGLHRRETKTVVDVVGKELEERPVNLDGSLPFAGRFAVSPFDPETFFARQLPGELERALGGFARSRVEAEGRPGRRQREMTEREVRLRGDHL